MPMKFRQKKQLSDGRTVTIIYTNLALEALNFCYDYIYSPFTNLFKYENNNKKEDEDIIHTLNMVEDKQIYDELKFCLDNKDNMSKKYDIENIIQKYNKKGYEGDIASVCLYLMKYLTPKKPIENEIYYIDM